MFNLEISHVSKTYNKNKGNEVICLRDINLKAKEGEFLAVSGRSGSGKTTLLNIISGLIKADSGEVRISGKIISSLNDCQKADIRREEIGFVFQSYKLITVLTVEENIKLVRTKQNIDEEYFDFIVENLGLKDKLKFLPEELSGGQQQRVSIARALINKPKILLADEPTGNLDSKTELQVMNLFKVISKNLKITIVFITHNYDLIKFSDRCLILNDGILKEN